jgi:transcriptional antiterminator NusG
MGDDEFRKELEQLKKQAEQKEEKQEEPAAEKKEEPEDKNEFDDIMSEMMESGKKPAEEEKQEEVAEEEAPAEETAKEPVKQHIFALRTTANREDQVMDFVSSNARKKKIEVYSVIRPHGMRGYIFLEASSKTDAEQAAFNVPYARGILPKEIEYSEIEHMLEQVRKEVNIRKNDIAEIISGPFKREKCKVTRIDKAKEEVVVELLEAAVPIPITVKMDAIKVIRRDTDESEAQPESSSIEVPPSVESSGTGPSEDEEY